MRKVLLVGNPNCGKTTLFNLLTQSTERVGNWSGVTVEKKRSHFVVAKEQFEILDLPGVYSLNLDDNTAQDALITAREVAENDVSLLVNVVDACHLERHLYLTTQLLELEIPIIVVVNMCDLAKSRKIKIDKDLLAKQLDCPVVLMEANKKLGLEELYKYLTDVNLKTSRFKLNFTDELKQSIQHKLDKKNTYFKACREVETLDNLDIAMADTRYTAIHKITKVAQQQGGKQRDNLTAKIDNLVLNRILALPIFVGVMYVMFLFAINLGGVLRDFFDITTSAVFVKGAAYFLTKLHAPNWLISILALGIGRGINTTASFIPVIFMMYLFLSLLESSGYMARAAFAVDRIMRLLGLPGKSFVPMIVGFGCNVPGIMAARTLESERDRILTVLMSPFMSCSARLAIYVVFVSAFFPHGGQNIVFSLYFIGILMAVFTGFILQKTLLIGPSAPLIIELPTYQIPTLKFLLQDAFTRLKVFLIKAGKLILPICVVLSMLENCLLHINGDEISIIAYLGKKLVPLFTPMGIGDDNWPAVVGLITGTLAKEVVIGTLNTLYSHIAQLNQTIMLYDFNLVQEIKIAFTTTYANILNFGTFLSNPIVASMNKSDLSTNAYAVMVQSFHTKSAAYAYLLFVLLYIPCVSTMAAIKQETNRKYMLLSISWSILLAYIVACGFYQLANFATQRAFAHNNLWFYIIISMAIFLIIFMWRKRNVIRAA